MPQPCETIMIRNSRVFAVSTSLGTSGLRLIVQPLAMSFSVHTYSFTKDGLHDPKGCLIKLTVLFSSYNTCQKGGHEGDARERQLIALKASVINTTGKTTYRNLDK